jgi:hypothetical protein
MIKIFKAVKVAGIARKIVRKTLSKGLGKSAAKIFRAA